MTNFILVFAVLLLSSTTIVESKVLHFEMVGGKITHYTWNEVCEKFGIRHLPLVSMHDLHRLDCMGKIVTAKEFCLSMQEDRPFVRASVNNSKKRIDCQYAKEAILSYECNEKDKFCAHEQEGCLELGKTFAWGLKVYKANLQVDGKPKLGCYFSKTDADIVKQFKALDPRP